MSRSLSYLWHPHIRSSDTVTSSLQGWIATQIATGFTATRQLSPAADILAVLAWQLCAKSGREQVQQKYLRATNPISSLGREHLEF
jgi:hypothetical protein